MNAVSDESAAGSGPAVRLRDAARRFGWTWALRGVDLEVRPGELVALAGPNGAGKTTLLRLLAGLLAPTRGEVEVLGRRPREAPDAVRRRTGYLPARGYLYDDLTARENLRFACRMSGIRGWEGPAAAALDRVGLGAAADVRVRGFSSGMRQRLALARLLLRPVELALLDEPYASLDRQGSALVDELVGEMRGRGATLLLAAHQWGGSLEAADRVVRLARGRVEWTGTPREYARRRAADLPGPGGPDVGAAASDDGDAGGADDDRDTGRPAGDGREDGGAAGAADRGAGPSPAPDTRAGSGGGSAEAAPDGTLRGDLAGVVGRAAALLWKDLLIEARTKGAFNAMAFFAALVLLVFAFAVGPDPDLLRRLAGGLLWVGIVFTGILSLGRTFHSEELSGGLEGLELYPGPVRAVYLGKLLGNLAILLLVEAVLFPTAAVLFQVDLAGRLLPLAGVAVLGTLGFSTVGTFYAALTLHLRAREVMLPVLLLPLLVPVLLGAVSATSALLGTGPTAGVGGWVRLLAAFDVIYFVVCTWTFPVVLER